MLVDIFARVENFFRRLESYKEVPPNAAMTDVIVKIMVEVLSILAMATTDISQGWWSELMSTNLSFSAHLSSEKLSKKFLGKGDIEGALKRLDALTQDETRMAIAEVLKVTHMIDDKIRILIDGV